MRKRGQVIATAVVARFRGQDPENAAFWTLDAWTPCAITTDAVSYFCVLKMNSVVLW